MSNLHIATALLHRRSNASKVFYNSAAYKIFYNIQQRKIKINFMGGFPMNRDFSCDNNRDNFHFRPSRNDISASFPVSIQ